MNTRNIKHVYDYEGSPCLNCIVKMICTKSALKNDVCQDYENFIIKMTQIIRGEQSR